MSVPDMLLNFSYIITINYYESNCTNFINSTNQDLSCKENISVSKCCRNFIKNLYNISYELNQCYNINNKYVNFICNKEIENMEEVEYEYIIIGSLIILLMVFILCIYIYIRNDYNFQKKKNFKNYLLVNQNTDYSTGY